ncbi:MAG: hypothetical protein B7Y49_12220 [Sphingomonas sp. 28-62-11]|nr:MAG: hypothetical protein B7Y49_12220 [Sphingomonas sp. 28-62-11]
MIGALREHEPRVTTPDLCRKHGINDATFYNWKSNYGGLTVSEAARLHALSSAPSATLDRMLPQEIAHIPDLTERFFDAGPAQCRRRLAGLLEEMRAAGNVAFEDCGLAADNLVALWKGFFDVELKFGVRHSMSSNDIEQRVSRGTAVFRSAYRP